MCPERHRIRLGTQFKCEPSPTTSLKNCVLYTYGAGSLPAELLEKMLAAWKKGYDQPRENNKKQRHYFADKGPSIQSYGFTSSHVWMWDHKESWAPKNWCFWAVVLEKTLKSPVDCKKIKPIYPKGNQSWIFIGRTDAEAEAPVLWPPDVKNWFIGKDPDAGKDWRWEEKGTTEDEMVGWHHRLHGHEFEQALWVGDGQRSLENCSPWGHKESDTTERLNWTELMGLVGCQWSWIMTGKVTGAME